MFMSAKRTKRDKQEPAGMAARFSDAVLKTSEQGLFLIDAKDKVLTPVSQSLAVLFRRQDFTNVTFQKILAPLVTAKTLTLARNHVAGLQSAAPDATANPLEQVDVRLTNEDGSYDTAQYSFHFDQVVAPNEPRAWLVRVTDITVRNHTARELEDLRTQVQAQGEILRSVILMGGARFGGFMQKTDASMKSIATVLKKPAREEDAFRQKLEEILNEVDRIRREAAAFRLSGLESSARVFEDALQDLRIRSALSGSDFLPLAVKLDQLFGQFAMVKSLTAAAGPGQQPDAAGRAPRTTNSGTAIMEAPKFVTSAIESAPMPGARRAAPAGSLENTLQVMTEHIALEHGKQVVLVCSGLAVIPPNYLAVVKNVAIQLIRNAVMHGIEPPSERKAAQKAARGTLRLEFRLRDDNFELLFEDDGRGLVPDQVRATAIARGVVTAEAATRLRDREAIKLIFKSRYTTLANSPEDATHGAGMSLVRRYVHEAGGRIALASLPGHETRFKMTLPASATDRPSPSAETAPGPDALLSVDPATAPADAAVDAGAQAA